MSNTLKHSNIRHVPKRRINFNYETPDGKLALVYKSAEKPLLGTWQAVLGSAIPALLLAPYCVPPEFLFYTYSAIFLPTAFGLFDSAMRRKVARQTAAEIYLFQNGEQLLLKSQAGVLHKLDILFNDKYHFKKSKRDDSLVFVMENSDREYLIKAKDAEVIDYQLIDKFIKAICIDTKCTQGYHRLVSRK